MENKESFGFVLAPKRLVEERLKIRFMYREKSAEPQDSGWRFFSGDETDEYVNEPSNIGVYDIKTILSIDEDIIPYLDSPYGSAYERKESISAFYAVTDFFLE